MRVTDVLNPKSALKVTDVLTLSGNRCLEPCQLWKSYFGNLFIPHWMSCLLNSADHGFKR
jgi:hypothetical protein